MRLVEDRDYFVCDWCTAFAFPDENPDGVRPLGQETELDCPVCARTLELASISGVEVLQCDRCEGVLVYRDDFPVALRHRASTVGGPPRPPQPLRNEDWQRRLACPMCDELMDLHPYYGPGQVLIDTCVGCAVMWLDRGEMDIIARASAHEWSKHR